MHQNERVPKIRIKCCCNWYSYLAILGCSISITDTRLFKLYRACYHTINKRWFLYDIWLSDILRIFWCRRCWCSWYPIRVRGKIWYLSSWKYRVFTMIPARYSKLSLEPVRPTDRPLRPHSSDDSISSEYIMSYMVQWLLICSHKKISID